LSVSVSLSMPCILCAISAASSLIVCFSIFF